MKARSFLVVVTVFASGLTGSLSARDTHELLNGSLWMQTAPEYMVACKVVYATAQKQLDVALATPKWTAALEQVALGGYEGYPAAVIMDLDETVFDNSRFEAQMAFQRSSYDPTLWTDWVRLHAAGAVPGALEFIKYVTDKKNVEIFYVTNRSGGTPSEKPDTLLNLNELLAPLKIVVSADHILMKDENGWVSDKTERRKTLAQKYRILLLVGDDLGDFVAGAKNSIPIRQKLAMDNAARWGDSWLLLPNPLYGSWETATYDNDKGFSDDRVLQRKWSKLVGFPPTLAPVPTPASTPAPALAPAASKPIEVPAKSVVPVKETDRRLLTVPTDYP